MLIWNSFEMDEKLSTKASGPIIICANESSMAHREYLANRLPFVLFIN